jgi:hypothetical protein
LESFACPLQGHEARNITQIRPVIFEEERNHYLASIYLGLMDASTA